jgi:Ydr279p protein triple barrel domain
MNSANALYKTSFGFSWFVSILIFVDQFKCCSQFLHCESNPEISNVWRAKSVAINSMIMTSSMGCCRQVILFAPEDQHISNCTNRSVVTLPHPSTGEDVDMLLIESTVSKSKEYHLYEIQALEESKYGSFFCGSHVGSDGTLYVATRVDPLFWIVSESLLLSPWRPLDQMDIPDAIRKALSHDERQYHHIFKVNRSMGEDMVLYKLCEKKVLHWIEEKRNRVYHQVKEQMLEEKETANLNLRSSHCSTRSSGFELLDEKDSNGNSELWSEDDEFRCQRSSWQVVCDSLCPAWRVRVLQVAGQSESIMLGDSCATNSKDKHGGNQKTSKRLRDDDEDLIAMVTMEKPSIIVASSAQSIGLKRLSKVSTKGMKSLSSFFTVKSSSTGN